MNLNWLIWFPHSFVSSFGHHLIISISILDWPTCLLKVMKGFQCHLWVVFWSYIFKFQIDPFILQTMLHIVLLSFSSHCLVTPVWISNMVKPLAIWIVWISNLSIWISKWPLWLFMNKKYVLFPVRCHYLYLFDIESDPHGFEITSFWSVGHHLVILITIWI